MSEPTGANWYVVVTCEECQHTIVLFRDLTNGKSKATASYVVSCPKCKHQGRYDGRHYRDGGEARNSGSSV